MKICFVRLRPRDVPNELNFVRVGVPNLLETARWVLCKTDFQEILVYVMHKIDESARSEFLRGACLLLFRAMYLIDVLDRLVTSTAQQRLVVPS